MAKENKFVASENKTRYRSQVNDSFAKETALYESFFQKITDYAKTHKQITINNLNQVETRLRQLKKQAATLQESILFHDEEVVVERSKIIRNTENLTHDQNENILHYDRMNADEIINAVDYLSKALLTVKRDFFDFHEHAYLNEIIANESYFDFYTQKSQKIQAILDKHQDDIYRMFTELDDEIKYMDDNISRILSDKNQKMLQINAFYEKELKHYSDNQLTYSAESDPTSIEVQALTSDKINQYNTFKEHQNYQNAQIRQQLHVEYMTLFNHIFGRLLRSKSYDWVKAYDFFETPDVYLNDYKLTALDLERIGNKKDLIPMLNLIQKLEQWPTVKKHLEKKAHHLLRKQMHEKVRMIVYNEKYSAKQLSKMELALDQYLQVMKIEPFLAQSLGDESSTLIKDERMYLSVLKVNKELKANINYDIQTAKIKSDINSIETNLRYAVKKTMYKQEIEILDEILDINHFVLSESLNRALAKQSILKERALIERLDKAANEHLAYLIESFNTNRMWLSLVSQALIDATRSKETHNIYVAEAKSKIEYILKQYEMKALFFKAMYENELSYLVGQQSRVDNESKIHNEFVLNTYLNQMRYAEEQVKFAEYEYRLRLEAITETIDGERAYHQEMINTTKHRYSEQIKVIKNEYEAYYYQDSRQLEFAKDDKVKKSVIQKIEKATKSRDQKINVLIQDMSDNQVIHKAESELTQLDEYLHDAINDATELRDTTINEFSELYLFAKERYDVLKPYLESSVNILDPTFYDMLERINNRMQFQMKKAEIELDDNTKDLMKNYLEIYFKKTEEINQKDYNELMDDINTSREQIKTRYASRLQAVESAFVTKMSELSRIDESMKKEVESLKINWKTRHDTTVVQLKQQLLSVDNEYLSQVKIEQAKTEKTVARLSSEYRLAIKTNRQFTDGVAEDFNKLIKSYRPYIKIAKKEIEYNKIVKPLIKKNRIKLKRSLRDIELRYHRYQIRSVEENSN